MQRRKPVPRAVVALLAILTILLLAACGAAGGAAPTATPLVLPEATPVAEPPVEQPAEATPAAPAATPASGTAAVDRPESCELRPVNVTLNATGASFPNPIYQRWIEEYAQANPSVTINYQSTGSGQGKSDFIQGVTVFGGTDALFTDEEHNQAPGTLFIPTVLGAVAATYNLPGIEGLQFSPETLAGIYLGQITNWNDPAIAGDNPGVALPDQDITVVYRSDGSGTTFIFTDYLSKVSQEWADRVGFGTAVEWPTGIGGDRNDGVAAAVTQTPGAIGYVELIFALANNLPAPAIQNAAGEFVTPTIKSATEAAAGFLNEMPENLQFTVTNPPEGGNAYPIAGFTWLLVRPEYDNIETAQAITDFLCWAMTEGDDYASALHYAPLPDVVQQQAFRLLETVTVNGEQVFIAPQ
jgi:phosphate transport system substrate-binding protein